MEDLEDADSVNESPQQWLCTLRSMQSLADSKAVVQEEFPEYVKKLDRDNQEKFRRQFRVSN